MNDRENAQEGFVFKQSEQSDERKESGEASDGIYDQYESKKLLRTPNRLEILAE